MGGQVHASSFYTHSFPPTHPPTHPRASFDSRSFTHPPTPQPTLLYVPVSIWESRMANHSSCARTVRRTVYREEVGG